MPDPVGAGSPRLFGPQKWEPELTPPGSHNQADRPATSSTLGTAAIARRLVRIVAILYPKFKETEPEHCPQRRPVPTEKQSPALPRDVQ
jgi:hypothetical protein